MADGDAPSALGAFWAKYGRYIVTGLILLALLVIWLWPQKTGDMRQGANNQPEIYWRGPNPNEPGAWLPQNPNISPNTQVNSKAVRTGTVVHINGQKVVDAVPVGRGRCVIVLEAEDGTRTAALVKDG